MPRKLRVEYEGAVYHVMCRGNSREAIFLGDRDRETFLDTLGEVCERTGWIVHAYVLMTNHYHMQIETPEPNLVAGMKWFQGTYTQRFHARNRTCGHLFQGRYKAIPVSGEDDYFPTLGTYIHLNPVRARISKVLDCGLGAYPWSSYPFYIRGRRPNWLQVDRVLGALGFVDSPRGRRGYKDYMAGRLSEVVNAGAAGKQLSEWRQLRRGWYFGDKDFRMFLENRMDSLPGKRESFSGGEMKRHDEQEAERLLAEGLRILGLTLDEVRARKYSDPDKCLIAWLVRRKTSVPNRWICECLVMGRVDCFSRYPRRIEETKDRQILRKRKKLEKIL